MTTDIGNEELLRCAELVGHRFSDLALLKLALTHSSYSAEETGEPSNERLEFLGDAVLGWVLADEMFRRHPDFHEGLLTDLRKRGIRCRLYVPFANSWGLAVQYLRRRLDEYPAMVWLVTKNLFSRR